MLRQLGGHLAAIRLVALICHFLKGLSLDVELPNLGDCFRLLIPKGGCCDVKYGGQIFRREVLTQFTKHVDEDICGRGWESGLGGHATLPRHGMVGAENEGHGIHQKDAAAIGRGQLRLGGRGCRRGLRRGYVWGAFNLSSRGFLPRRQETSLTARKVVQGATPFAGSGSVSTVTPCHPEEAESFARRRAPRRRTCVLPDDRSAKTLPDPVMRFRAGFCADTAGEECTGPSFAFIPLRETKDCTQDDSLAVPRILGRTESR